MQNNGKNQKKSYSNLTKSKMSQRISHSSASFLVAFDIYHRSSFDGVSRRKLLSCSFDFASPPDLSVHPYVGGAQQSNNHVPGLTFYEKKVGVGRPLAENVVEKTMV